jgi:hypothetical protein
MVVVRGRRRAGRGSGGGGGTSGGRSTGVGHVGITGVLDGDHASQEAVDGSGGVPNESAMLSPEGLTTVINCVDARGWRDSLACNQYQK